MKQEFNCKLFERIFFFFLITMNVILVKVFELLVLVFDWY